MNQSLNANTSSTQLLICRSHSLLSHPHLPGCSRILGECARRRASCGRIRTTSNASLPHRHEWTRAGKSSHLSLYTRKVILASLCLVHYSLPSVGALTTAPRTTGLAAAASTSSTTALGTRDASRMRTPLRRSTTTAADCGNGCRARNPAYRTSFTTAITSKVVFLGTVWDWSRREVMK